MGRARGRIKLKDDAHWIPPENGEYEAGFLLA